MSVSARLLALTNTRIGLFSWHTPQHPTITTKIIKAPAAIRKYIKIELAGVSNK